MISGAFAPGRSYTLLVGGTASNAVPIDPDASSLRLLNMGPEIVFVRVGVGGVSAVVGDYALAPLVPVTITKGVGANSLSAINSDNTGASTTTLYATTGEGL